MSDNVTDPSLNRGEHIEENVQAKRVVPYGMAPSGQLSRLRAPFVPNAYDYVALSQSSTADTWSFRAGGSGGTLVNTVTVNYTDSTKNTISNIALT